MRRCASSAYGESGNSVVIRRYASFDFCAFPWTSYACAIRTSSGWLASAAYVGNKAIHLPVDRNINATPNKYLSTLPVRDPATINALSATVPNPFYGLNSVYPKTIAVADLPPEFRPGFSARQKAIPVGKK